MKKRSKRMLVVGGAALAVVGGGGAALAAGGNPFGGSNDRQAVINDAAQRLNVKPAELQSALKQAMLDRIDAALKAGRITQQQATELKARVNAGDGLGPLFPAATASGSTTAGRRLERASTRPRPTSA